MNKKLVFSFIGKLCFIEALLLILPMIVAVIYRENWLNLQAFLITIIILIFVSFLSYQLKPKKNGYTLKEGLAITSLSWFALSFFGALPFVFSGQIPSLVDACFEMASGFTTTGSSILENVEELSQSMLFWRSFSHLIGGMGILVFAFAFAPQQGEGSVNIMKAEVPGPQFGKLVAKNKNTARINYRIYLVMTLIFIILLWLSGLNLFDAMIHAFGAAGTGGFSNKALSVAHFNNPAVEYILSIAMLLFGVNFNLYYFLLNKQIKTIFKNEELRLYLGFVLISLVLIMINISTNYNQVEPLFRDSLFTVTTIVSTTGYATADFDQWPLFSKLIIMLLMFTGSMAGSTAGGIKISRILVYLKTIKREIKLAIQPRRVFPLTIDRNPISEAFIKQTFIYLGTYVLIFITGLLLLSLDRGDFLTDFSAVSATLNNIGPGFSGVGPRMNFSDFNDFSKIVMTILMIIGRLEIFPVLILINTSIWKKR